jgi:Spy/CpxP family protein refolding chaperone
MKKSNWITGAAVLALSGALAFAGPNGHHGKHGKGQFGDKAARQERLAAELNLSADQKKQWDDTQQAFMAANKTFFVQSHETMKDYRDAKEANDTAKADSLKPTVEANRAQMKQLRETQNAKLMSILNEDQKAQFQKMMAERREGHRHGHNRGGAEQE